MQNQHNVQKGQPHGASEADINLKAKNIVIDLEDHCLREHPFPDHDPGIEVHFVVKIDLERFTFRRPVVTGAELLLESGKDPKRFRLVQILRQPGHGNQTRVIDSDETVDLRSFGIERFITEAIKIKFFIDRTAYVTEEPCLTVRQILVDFAKVDPAEKTLADKKDCAHQYENLDELICLEQGQTFTLFDNAPTPLS